MTKTLYPLLALLALLLSACGGGDDSSDGPIDAAKVLSDATAAAAGVKSFHFRLTHENGATPIPLNLDLTEAEGDVVVPDRLAADVKAKAGAITASVKVIAIADKTWVTNPFTRRWQELPGASIRDLADPPTLLRAVLGAVKDPEVLSEGELDGTRCYRLTGVLDAGALQAALPVARANHEVATEVWIGVDDGLTRRVRLTGRLADSEPANIVRQIDLSRFNAAVDIQPPPE